MKYWEIIADRLRKAGWSLGWVAVDSEGRTIWIFHTGSAKKLTFGQSLIITVIGKAYWDVGHAPKDQGNRRKYMPDYAVWEIHPVMKMDVAK